MALVPRLDQRQSQSLVMTPQLQQAIKLLQMSNMELSKFITEELEQNPMLESEEAGRRGGAEDAERGAAAAAKRAARPRQRGHGAVGEQRQDG